MSIFKNAAKTAFNVARKLSVTSIANFKSVYDNGMDDPVITTKDVEIIKEKFSIDDDRGLTFGDKIQPADIKLYVLGDNIEKIGTNDTFTINSIEYTVFGCEIDAANAVWICGVR
jgi:hypothetical protein